MNEELIIAIAFKAMDFEKEIRIEKGKNASKSSTLGGVFSESSTDYDSLSLLVYEGGEHEDLADEDEEEAEEAEEAEEDE